MPNFHPQLVAAVAPFLDPGEEVWAVYPAEHRSLVATAKRLFLVGPDRTIAYPLREFELMRRPRPSLVLLQRRGGGAMRIPLDPRDEHGIQALTVIGLLVASVARPRSFVPGHAVAARVAPSPRHRLATHGFVLRGGSIAMTVRRVWTGGWAGPGAAPGRHAIRCARPAYRLGLARLRRPVAEHVE